MPAIEAGFSLFPRNEATRLRSRPTADHEGGTMHPRETLRIVERLDLSKADRDKIFFKNFEALTGRRLVKASS